jgi:hypothetical protein
MLTVMFVFALSVLQGVGFAIGMLTGMSLVGAIAKKIAI